MARSLRLGALIVGLMVGMWGCGDDDEGQIVGPEFDPGEGRVYPIREVSFPSIDGVQVQALFGQPQSPDQALPVVILVHDFTQDNQEWFFSPFFAELLEQYLVLAIDLRGHGSTPLPEDRGFYDLPDLENSYRDVLAAITWLKDQPGVDVDRIAVVGTGVGGNIAFVSMGVFPQQIKTVVALSPGLWDSESHPLVTGAGLDPFEPHSILFMVGRNDVIPLDSGDLSFVDFASDLAFETDEPKNLVIVEGSDAHGLELLIENAPAADRFFAWLEDHL